jgi:hypothetical protein
MMPFEMWNSGLMGPPPLLFAQAPESQRAAAFIEKCALMNLVPRGKAARLIV